MKKRKLEPQNDSIEKRITRRAFLEAGCRLLGAMWILPSAGCLFAQNPSEHEADDAVIFGRIDDNHDHSVKLMRSQLESNQALVIDITGGATHPHTITLSTANLAAIRQGQYVYVRSTVDWGHEHGVHFNTSRS